MRVRVAAEHRDHVVSEILGQISVATQRLVTPRTYGQVIHDLNASRNSQPTGGVMNAEPQEQDTTPEEQPRAYTWADEAHIGIPNSERK